MCLARTRMCYFLAHAMVCRLLAAVAKEGRDTVESGGAPVELSAPLSTVAAEAGHNTWRHIVVR
jgi:hypothetical protein